MTFVCGFKVTDVGNLGVIVVPVEDSTDLVVLDGKVTDVAGEGPMIVCSISTSSDDLL